MSGGCAAAAAIGAISSISLLHARVTCWEVATAGWLHVWTIKGKAGNRKQKTKLEKKEEIQGPTEEIRNVLIGALQSSNFSFPSPKQSQIVSAFKL